MSLALDPETGDLAIEGGNLFLLTGADAVAQYAGQRLRTFLSEWFLDEQRGFPWFDLAFQKNPDLVALDAALKNYILSSPGVVELTAFSLEPLPSTRELNLSFSARSADGTIEFNERFGA